MKSVYFLLVIVFCFSESCTNLSNEEPTPVVEGLKSIHIRNFTGHLIRRGGELCGEGLTVRFVLSSESDTREQLYPANTYTNTVLQIERGDRLTVTAYEVRGHEDIFLTRNSTIYDPPDDTFQKVFPSIELCPRDVITFYDVNGE